MFFTMKDGGIEGLILWGQNPAVGGQNAALQRAAMGQLKWMVCQDLFETESAAFWKREGVDPATIGTEVFFMPAAAIAEKAGTLTNTMRLVQFHEKAVDRAEQGAQRSVARVQSRQAAQRAVRGLERRSTGRSST